MVARAGTQVQREVCVLRPQQPIHVNFLGQGITMVPETDRGYRPSPTSIRSTALAGLITPIKGTKATKEIIARPSPLAAPPVPIEPYSHHIPSLQPLIIWPFLQAILN